MHKMYDKINITYGIKYMLYGNKHIRYMVKET